MTSTRRRALARGTALALAALAGLALAAVGWSEELAARLIRARVGPGVAFDVRSVGLHGITLADIRGRFASSGLDALAVDHLRVGWTLVGVWSGEIRALSARGIRADIRAADASAPRDDSPSEQPRREREPDAWAFALDGLRVLTLEDTHVAVHAGGMVLQAQIALALDRSGSADLSGPAVLAAAWDGGSAVLAARVEQLRASPRDGGERFAAFGRAYVDAHYAPPAAGSGVAARAVAQASIAGWLTFSMDGAAAELSTPDCIRLGIQAAERAGAEWLPKRLEICVMQGDAPLVRVTHRDAGIEANVEAQARAFHIVLGEREPETPALAAQIESLSLNVHRSASGVIEGRVSAEGGRLHLPTAQIAMEGWRGTAALGPRDAWRAHLYSDVVSDLATSAKFAPFAASVEASRASDAEWVTLRVTARSPDGLALHASGHHDVTRSAGELTLDDRDTHDAVAVLAALPRIQSWIEEAEGEVGLGGRVAWRSGEIDIRLDVLPRGMDLVTSRGRFRGVEGQLRLLGPQPWTTPESQTLHARSFEYGIEIENIRVRLALARGGVLAIDDASGRVAGGDVTANGAYDPSARASAFDVRLAGIDFGKVLDRIDLPGLEGTGKVGGRLPVVLREGAVEIQRGELTATDGTIRYHPSPRARALAESRADVDLAFDVLRNFHYDLLRARMDGPLREVIETTLYVEGRNPDVEGGREVQLTLNLDARLADLLRLPALDIPEPVRDRIEEGIEGS